jgi:hypothetical protein
MLMPMSRSGMEINQTIGQITNASNAIGQHRINRINHPMSESTLLALRAVSNNVDSFQRHSNFVLVQCLIFGYVIEGP